MFVVKLTNSWNYLLGNINYVENDNALVVEGRESDEKRDNCKRFHLKKGQKWLFSLPFSLFLASNHFSFSSSKIIFLPLHSGSSVNTIPSIIH